jgi:type II secretory pathway pseudopilin PulG
MKYFKKESGYTMIELLTVIGILVVVSGIIIGILSTTLRGTEKTKTTTSVAQNGNYALSVITNAIIASYAVTGVGDSTATSNPPFVDCTNSPVGQSISLKSSTGEEITFACTNDTIASNGASIIDTSQVKVDTSSESTCSFKCTQPESNPYDIPIVEISFTVSDKAAAGAFLENKSSGVFKTSVSLRNFNP